MQPSTRSSLFETLSVEGHEQVMFCSEPSLGLRAIISIHSTALGPGAGGCRLYPYPTEADALRDVLRLSKGMTYKSAISGLKLGGAKAVILQDPHFDLRTTKTPALLRRYGQFVDSLNGSYITAKDVGITSDDLRVISTVTRHVMGIEGVPGSSGDPSPATAWGVYHGMKAGARRAFGTDSLAGKRIAIQGLGAVSYYLLPYLIEEGAKIIATDVDVRRIEKCQREYPIAIVRTDEILQQECDILAPCALGAVLNAQSIPQIKAALIAGAANNQLATDEDGFSLEKRGILYAPDYAINAGGIMNIAHEIEGYSKERAYDHIAGIGQTIDQVLRRSAEQNIPPHRIADQMAEERVQAARATHTSLSAKTDSANEGVSTMGCSH